MRHVYVHAGGKVEALGTGVWAAPRTDTATPGVAMAVGDDTTTNSHQGSQQQHGAPSPSPGTGTIPLVTVETVCVVDIRENCPPTGTDDSVVGAAALAAAMEDPSVPLPTGAAAHFASGPGGGRAPVFATSVLPGELTNSVISSGGGRVSGRAGDKAAARLRRQGAARRRTERRIREQEGSR